jgi:hypothetical protein
MQALARIPSITQGTWVLAPCDTMKLVDCPIDFCLVVTPGLYHIRLPKHALPR